MNSRPALALADASVVQEYCEQYTPGSNDLIIVHFTVVNFSLPADVCDLHFAPEPYTVPNQRSTWGAIKGLNHQ